MEPNRGGAQAVAASAAVPATASMSVSKPAPRRTQGFRLRYVTSCCSLRAHLPGPDVPTAEQRLGSPDDYCGHTLYVEPDGSFSIVALVWRSGQITRIHDHGTWCAFGVIQGVEHEELFDADLNLVGRNENQVGDVSGFAPPGDIHRVHNTSETTAISIHIYGTDITRIGSSARRYYD
jgi:3-mercaptopropionate dioxygenase